MHHNEDKIQEIFEALQRIFGQLENIRIQQARYDSDLESEKQTRKERNAGIDEQIGALRDLIYNRKTGLAFEIDRMIQRDIKRDEMNKWVRGTAAAVVLLILKEIWNAFNN